MGKRKQGGPLYKEARRDVNLSLRPQINAIGQAETGAQQDYQKSLQAARSAYGGYQEQLAGLPGIHADAVSGDLQDQLAKFSGLLGGGGPGVDQSVYGLPTGLPTSEVATGNQLYGTLGANAFGNIAGDKLRNAEYMQSAGREGALAQRYAGDNLLQDLNNQMDQLSQQRTSLYDYVPQEILQRLDQLKLTNQSNKSNDAFTNFLIDYLGGQVGGGGGGGGGGGKSPSGSRLHHNRPKSVSKPAGKPGQGGSGGHK